MACILSIDQSTSGTKALLFDSGGALLARRDLPHRQMIDERGWVEHDLEEIYRNTLQAVRMAVTESGITRGEITGIGISNQRETAAAWDRRTGQPVYNAIVWQCPRGEEICRRLRQAGRGEWVKQVTGLPLSPYFTAAKLAWMLENVPAAREAAREDALCCGTIDSWLLFRLTGGRVFKTDYSNASRTQLFDLEKLKWSGEMCALFGLSTAFLPEVCGSDTLFGYTDLEGLLEHPIPIHGVLGDSHGALFGQGALAPGGTKATYGTGSSVMMNTGDQLCRGANTVASLAWGMGGKVSYVLEGNINYTGAVIAWAKDLGLLKSAREAGALAARANPADATYLVPAFTGLGAPYWDSGARAALVGMGRTTGRAELVRAAEESIAYQITDVLMEMRGDSGGLEPQVLLADGGPTRDRFLMQFQADLLGRRVEVSTLEELSGAGAAYMAGLGLGIYSLEGLFAHRERKAYTPAMPPMQREQKYAGWKQAVSRVLSPAAGQEGGGYGSIT